MIRINGDLSADRLAPAIDRMWQISAGKIRTIEAEFDRSFGAPVYTAGGSYRTRGWTDWTQGFQYGSAILQFDATGDEAFLELGRQKTRELMDPHVTHFGVHDHGFNNVSTYGNLLRLMNEGRIAEDAAERCYLELALKASGSIQALRWTHTEEGGFIHSFNGPHSLFADTIRSLRVLALAHRLGHELVEEHDERVSLLERLIEHAAATAEYTVYYGQGRDSYDVRGRVAHESLFNTSDGRYRCPSTQQGYSPFTTWTRGLAWVMLGFAELLEFLPTVDDADFDDIGGRNEVQSMMMRAARATCDHYVETTPADGIPYWDTGAPGLVEMPDHGDRPADPFNDHEPVDSSAAAIAAQGLLRMGNVFGSPDDSDARHYRQAGLTVLSTLLEKGYVSEDPTHQGLLLHSVYHRPNGWDHVPEGRKIPCGEASMWGDYHLREAALYLKREIRGEPRYTFFGPTSSP